MSATKSKQVQEFVEQNLLSVLSAARSQPLPEREKMWKEFQRRWHPDKNLGDEATCQEVFAYVGNQKDWFLEKDAAGMAPAYVAEPATLLTSPWNPGSFVEGFADKPRPEWKVINTIVVSQTLPLPQKTFRLDELLKTIHPAILRKGQSTSSELLAEIPPGTPLMVLGVGSGYRLYVSAVQGQVCLDGWLSSHTQRLAKLS
ncbi:unnamed protein product [Polarella glacialis]|uniref:J domain-containing protein n=1 Tax=Polarella glacialis TaxID=89957 RepID=A0A813KYD6_POLGL|nr:unnamed protein product [Polarella glacialis]